MKQEWYYYTNNLNYLNYWSLFIDFIEKFKEITYRDLPLPLLSPFNVFLNPHLLRKINSNSFHKILPNKISRQEMIQPAFNTYLQQMKRKNLSDKNGYTIINDWALNTDGTPLTERFDPKRTILFSRNKRKAHKNSPFKVRTVKDYVKKQKILKHIEDNVTKAEKIFSTLSDHPIFGSKKFQSNFLRSIPTMIGYIEAINVFFDHHPAACILVGTTQHKFPRTLTLVGYTRGIPSICLQHGNIVGEASFMPVFATKNAVFTDVDKEWYVKRGVKIEQLEITGHPKFDYTYQYRRPRVNKTMDQRKFRNKKKWKVLVATQFALPARLYERVISKLAEDPSIEVIIKPHPKETRLRKKKFKKRFITYQRLERKYQSVKVLTKKMSLYPLILKADFVVVWSSTVGLEAMLLDKPVFMLDTQLPKSYYKLYRELKPLIHVNPNKLAAAIRKTISSERKFTATQKLIRNFIKNAYPQSTSSERLEHLLTSLRTIHHDDKEVRP